MNAPATHPIVTPATAIDLRNLAFRRLDAEGKGLDDDADEGHAITHFPALGLMFDIRKPQTVTSTAAAQKYAAKCDLLGRKGDWIIGEDVEAAVLIDRRFRAPAVNPRVAPNMPSSGWVYTATKLKGSSGYVWFVALYYGYVVWGNGVYEGLAVPVLRVPPSQ